MTKPTVLITGGLGYLGSRLAIHLRESGRWTVRVGARNAHRDIPRVLEGCEPIALDVTDEFQVRAACEGVNAIVHLAALNDPDSRKSPARATEVTTIGTLRLLEAAQAAGANRFLYFSTAHVYGAPLRGQIDERSVPRPAGPYAITHHAAEDFVLAARDARKIEGVVVRLSNALGAPAHAGVNAWMLVANDLCKQAVTERALTLKSAGLQSRDFIPLTDVEGAVEFLLSAHSADLGDGLFNLGGDRTLRIIDLAELIAERCANVLGFRPKLIHPEPGPNEKTEELKFSIEKLRKAGFSGKSSLQDEIDRTLRFCRENF